MAILEMIKNEGRKEYPRLSCDCGSIHHFHGNPATHGNVVFLDFWCEQCGRAYRLKLLAPDNPGIEFVTAEFLRLPDKDHAGGSTHLPPGPEPRDGRRCENCRYWIPFEDDPHSEGLCRRDPPAILDTGSADEPYLDTFYPQTRRGQCCGEWASAPPSPTPPEGEPQQ